MSGDIVRELRHAVEADTDPWDETLYVRAADEIERLRAENERLRAAIGAFLADVDDVHKPEWSTEFAEAAGASPWGCEWCGVADGAWPCLHRMALDDLNEARK